MSYLLTHAESPSKKYMIITPEGKAIQFGQRGAEDFTIHGDDERKLRYLKRHFSREDWTDLNSAGMWSAWLLWNKRTIGESIKDIEKSFGIKIRKKI